MDEMVERVARAIEATMFAPHEFPLSDHLHARYLDTARAVIAAMREPTEAVTEGAHRAWDRKYGPGPFTIERMWRAGIDAALGPVQESDETARKGSG